MRIGLVGGIFGKPVEYQRQVGPTAEVMIADGLERLGHRVVRLAHRPSYAGLDLDLLHVHHIGLGVPAALGTVSRATPVVFTPHAWPLGAEWHARYRLGLLASDAVVVLSEVERSLVETRDWVGERPLAVIANPVEAESWPAITPPAPGPPWRLLYVGQLIRAKGLFELFTALADHRDVHLRLVFHIDHELAALRALAERLSIADRVEFVGPRRDETLVDEYAAAHALVLPSYRESLPYVVTEALLTGRPVLATRVGAIADQVAEAGILVAPQDAAALSAGLTRLLASWPTLVTAAAGRRDPIVATQAPDAIARRHEAFYEEVIRHAERRAAWRRAAWRALALAWARHPAYR